MPKDGTPEKRFGPKHFSAAHRLDNDFQLPTVLYNGMIAPLIPYAITRGATNTIVSRRMSTR